MAMQLKMSIISIDISLYVNKKKELYSIFHGQDFYLPKISGDSNENIKYSSKNCIIILEEFDKSINHLFKIQTLLNMKSGMQTNILRQKQLNSKNLIDQKTKYSPSEQDDDDDENDGVRAARLAVSHAVKDREKDINTITSDIKSLVKDLTSDTQNDDLSLQDLLELFQGPIPIKDRLIVATTNNFEEIKIKIPALFRSGRLTPVEFNYLDWNSLNELSQYYFDKQLTIPKKDIRIATSQIVEIAVKYALIDKDFNGFQSELSNLINRAS
jgi:hypothetical protein